MIVYLRTYVGSCMTFLVIWLAFMTRRWHIMKVRGVSIYGGCPGSISFLRLPFIWRKTLVRSFFSDDEKNMKKWKYQFSVSFGVSQGSREILNASIMTRRAEALAFSRRVIPRTGKIESHIPPRKDGVLHDIFGYLAGFQSLKITYHESPRGFYPRRLPWQHFFA